ncbi:uncharacterized protein LOC120106272 [Phoenix dactylifera]|uniref:Uncharacterized protein LOC120106272 n=1 Tax=Phoenix dactylifera TaxID=42345 RepID=A0A8B8ZUW1_PHODC|nr:uncharacterized protein LOC120106272 [Phoenix dactylifera]
MGIRWLLRPFRMLGYTMQDKEWEWYSVHVNNGLTVPPSQSKLKIQSLTVSPSPFSSSVVHSSARPRAAAAAPAPEAERGDSLAAASPRRLSACCRDAASPVRLSLSDSATDDGPRLLGQLRRRRRNEGSPVSPGGLAASPVTKGRRAGLRQWEAGEGGPRMNGAVEVRRPLDVSVFVFGSAAAHGDKVTLAGYCPVSDELEPCRWEIITTAGSDAPLFRNSLLFDGCLSKTNSSTFSLFFNIKGTRNFKITGCIKLLF